MIIGVMGQARSGKDTIAGMLVQRHGFVRVAFADPMKRFCREVFDFSYEQCWGDKRDVPDKRYPRVKPGMFRVELPDDYLTPRYALQTLGTQWGRDCYQNVWIEYGLRVAKRLLEDPYMRYSDEGGLFRLPGNDWSAPWVQKTKTLGVVFSDCRFRNEADAIQRAGGRVIKVTRPGCSGAVGIAGHASEAEQKGIPDSAFDAIIHNEGTLEALARMVDAVVKKFTVQEAA